MTYELHLGDCLEYMKSMPDKSVDAVITDPPYPELGGGTRIPNLQGVSKTVHETYSVGDIWNANWDWVNEAWRVCRDGMLIFCSFHSVDTLKNKLRKNATALITWYKRNTSLPVNNVPWFRTEFIWIFKKSPRINWRQYTTLYDIPAVPSGCMGNEREKNRDGSTAHPTQKPLRLMRELIKPDGILLVFDPFMGSGTTGVACMQLGRNFIGCEIDEKYFKIAEKRIKNASLQPQLFPSTSKNVEEQQDDFLGDISG